MKPAALAAAAVCLAAVDAAAQTPQAPVVISPYRTVNLNYVYAADLGFGGYSLAGLTASVYTLPLGYTLPGTFLDGWKLRLMLPVQGGFYNFHATDVTGQKISISQQSLSVVPGAELQIPIGPRSVVKPFAHFGISQGFGQGIGNPYSWIYLTGVRALTQWHDGETTFSLGNAVVFAGDNTIGPGFNEHYVSLQIGGEVRHPLGFTVGRIAPDIGLYVVEYYYPSPLQFSRFLKPPLEVSDQFEIGFNIGSAKPFELLGWSNPRIGVGYVFGGGLDVWHVNFGFQF
nr:hypothetical protein [uncultured Rhodopila sp.]